MNLRATLLLLAVPLSALAASPAPDALGWTMIVLVAAIGLSIQRYASRYLDGQAAQGHFEHWFLATLFAVSVLVLAGDLRVLAIAWTGSSLALHQLLTFFDKRPASLVAAHKKFLLSRLADVAIYGGVYLVGSELGTYRIDALAAAAAGGIPVGVHVGGALLALGVVLRSAQLPFHGWLIQVMEAPTPVSALLHAGVVNIGGFVMIRLADLGVMLPAAQGILVVFGAATAAVAALVMTTRVTVKVALAWSTAAQMGFMLVECGLGAHGLALLHLVAHSFYKAHAFLSSGSVVARFTESRVVSGESRAGIGRWGMGAIAGGLVAGLAVALVWRDSAADPRTWFAAGLLAVALAPLFVAAIGAGSVRTGGALVALALGIAGLYVGLHGAATQIVPEVGAPPHIALLLWTAVAFGGLFAVQLAVTTRPHGAFARRLYPHAYSGFHLDEFFTRATFLIWPPRHVRQLREGRRSAVSELGRAA